MTSETIDERIEEIRRRNEERSRDWCTLEPHGCWGAADIDTLLEIIGELRAKYRALCEAPVSTSLRETISRRFPSSQESRRLLIGWNLPRSAIVFDVSLHNVTCLGCGTELVLWYTGGELDLKECCGYLYYLNAPVTLLVVERETGDEQT